MPLPTIADVARVSFNWATSGGDLHATNVMHFVRADNTKTLAQLAADIEANQDDDMWATVNSAFTCSGIDVIPLYDTTLTQHFDFTTPLQGRAATDAIPQACALIKLTTALRGRSHRGRVYLPPIGEGVQTAGVISSTPRDNTTAAWVAFANGLVGAGRWALCVASYKLRSAEQVTELICEPKTATQRKRNPR